MCIFNSQHVYICINNHLGTCLIMLCCCKVAFYELKKSECNPTTITTEVFLPIWVLLEKKKREIPWQDITQVNHMPDQTACQREQS